MSQTILTRIFAIADASHSGGGDLYAALASVCRKLASDDDPAEKAHTISGLVKKLTAVEQERLVSAVEGLTPKPAKA